MHAWKGTVGRNDRLRSKLASLSIVIGAPPPPIIIVRPQLRASGVQSGTLTSSTTFVLHSLLHRVPIFSRFLEPHSIIRLYYGNAATSMSGAQRNGCHNRDRRQISGVYLAASSSYDYRTPRTGILLKFCFEQSRRFLVEKHLVDASFVR